MVVSPETPMSGDGIIRESGEPFHYEVRLLEAAESGIVADLHRHVTSLLPPRLYLYERDAPFFRRCLERGGCVAGAFDGPRLIAYATLRRPSPDEENYGEDLGLPADALSRVGHLAGSAVHPRYRGNGLQRRVGHLRNAAAKELGVEHMCGEVVPSNLISIHNHLRQGYHIEADKIDRFDLVCFLLHMRLSGAEGPGEPEDVVETSARDIEECRELLRSGRCGYEVVSPTGDAHIRFGRFATH
jgi:GNAT superfamily N-acetyltransferase